MNKDGHRIQVTITLKPEKNKTIIMFIIYFLYWLRAHCGQVVKQNDMQQ